jgi:hypothetical protein
MTPDEFPAELVERCGKAAAAVWTSENKGADKEQSGVLFQPTAIAVLRASGHEALLRNMILKCYGAKTTGFQVSSEHYRYLAEQIVALREHDKRRASNHAELVAERDIAWASNAGLTTDVLAIRAQNAELVAALKEASFWLKTCGHWDVAKRSDDAAAAAGHTQV